MLLRSALREAGFSEGECYLTNAVKHFKFIPRGKRRIHKTPGAREIDHCRWWLDRELALVEAQLVVTLGASALRASWLPKITSGWFFRAESFFSVARYLDAAALDVGADPPDFLSHSHGEGFLRFFQERCRSQGIFIFDEPESAMSPSRQIEFLKLLRRMERSGICQVLMATHSPILMACPAARLLQLSKCGLEPITVQDTDHYRMMREFCADPATFVDSLLEA